ncbi:unnamed protein product [Prorocentrum cordatum]|uniref:Uncharacterized protein n=1 Tax=Prorocentrum cordatum TaxID=2364126 RepID=A0ABN9WD50_9DINO|nr:unnamed protein product [Polarella glacialis]
MSPSGGDDPEAGRFATSRKISPRSPKPNWTDLAGESSLASGQAGQRAHCDGKHNAPPPPPKCRLTNRRAVAMSRHSPASAPIRWLPRPRVRSARAAPTAQSATTSAQRLWH